MSKKIILFLVEGQYDIDSFYRTIKNLCETKRAKAGIVKINIDFEPVGGDITRRELSIKSEIGNAVRIYMKHYRLTKLHILSIVHLTDTDGAFIEPENIKEHGGDIFYDDDFIYCRDVKKISKVCDENKNKNLNLSVLSATSKICEIDYSIYYFSCNLEHVLHDKRNLSNNEKNMLAVEFDKKYNKKADEFIAFINSDDFVATGDYAETWQFIKKDKNSLRRYSNFHLCINKLAEYT